MDPFLSLVIPAYNEASRLPRAMMALGKFAREYGRTLEVIIVVEPSSDGTLEIAGKLAAQQAESANCFEIVGNREHRGKGFAVRTGMLRARGEIVFYMDADLSVPLAEVNAFLEYFEGHPEIDALAGNRQHPEARITLAQSWFRRSMGQTFNRLLGLLALTEIRDTQCGFKAFRREVAREIFQRQRLDGFAFDVEVLALAQKLGFKAVDRPVEWINSPESKVHIVRDSARMALDALRVRRMVAQAAPLPRLNDEPYKPTGSQFQ